MILSDREVAVLSVLAYTKWQTTPTAYEIGVRVPAEHQTKQPGRIGRALGSLERKRLVERIGPDYDTRFALTQKGLEMSHPRFKVVSVLGQDTQ